MKFSFWDLLSSFGKILSSIHNTECGPYPVQTSLKKMWVCMPYWFRPQIRNSVPMPNMTVLECSNRTLSFPVRLAIALEL